MGNQERRIASLKRKKEALELRIAGVSYDAIATKLGYKSRSGAFEAVKTALVQTLIEPAEELRNIEVLRLDKALKAIWSQVLGGNLPAVDRYIKVAQRRADLLGLDAPKRTDVTSGNEALTFIIQRKDANND